VSVLNPYAREAGGAAEARPLVRFVAFGIVVVLGASLLLVRLYGMQVGSNAAQFVALANANRAVLQAVPSTRGLIYDSKGRPLVRNVASYSVKIRPADLPESRRDEVVQSLAALIGKDATDINVALDSNPGSRYDLVRVAADVDPKIADLIAESRQELPGVEVVVETRREYTLGPLFSQILGYTGAISGDELPDLSDQGYLPDDLIGRAGVEAVYEDQLRGQYGIETVERDASGKKIQVLQTNKQATPGDSLRLTIDSHVQQLAEQALKWGMQKAGLKRGAFIVMNPQTGAILAMASLPTYDDNLFADGISGKEFQKIVNDPNKPLLNHGVSGQYPPGSTYKMITGISGLADQRITTQTLIHTAGYITVGGTRFHDWNPAGFGMCNLTCGFEHSSDTYFYQLAERVGIERLSYWAHQFGFGQPTGIDLPNEAAGIIPSNQWKLDAVGEQIYPGDTVLAGIGQGFDAVSPLQLLNVYATVANGGTLHAPRVVGDIIGPDGKVAVPFKPQVIRKVPVSPDILRTMRVNARHVVTSGHTYNLVDLPIVIAGKTGTAEFGVKNSLGLYPYHEWFVGFVPKDPRKTKSDPGGYKAVARTDSQLAFVAFSYEANTRGNVSTEISKYFLQLYYGVKHDYRLPRLLERTAVFDHD
jgi:penicillin-binding protein 2